jgi:hypothetical protein
MSVLQQLEYSATEVQVQEFHKTVVFPEICCTVRRIDQQMMPCSLPSTDLPLSKPTPDIAYGLDLQRTEPPVEKIIRKFGGITNAKEDVAYTFLTVEFEGDGGMLSIALNQYLGDAAASIRATERLNKTYGAVVVDNICFSIAATPALAFVYLMCVQNGVYTMWTLKRFVLGNFDLFSRYRGTVRNILEWGSERCGNIVRALESGSSAPPQVIAAHMTTIRASKRLRQVSNGEARSLSKRRAVDSDK